MVDEVLPHRELRDAGGLRERVEGREPQIEVVVVVVGDLEEAESLRVGSHERRPGHALRLPERALVEEIVSHPGVADRRLGRDGLERGMGADPGERREPSGIGAAEHADLAAVAGNVLHQPVDGIEGVGGLIDAARILRVPLRAQGDEVAAGADAPADVLTHEDVAVLGELAVRPGNGGVPECASGGERRADEEDREGRGVVLRDQRDGEEGGAVADGDLQLTSLVPGRPAPRAGAAASVREKAARTVE